MVIYILTTQEDVANRMADRFAELYGYDVKVFTSPLKFCLSAAECNPGEVDLLASDYLSFDTDEYDPFYDMKSVNKVYPFVFYNVPFPSPEKRVEYWYNKIICNMREYLPDSKIPKLLKILEQFDQVMSSRDILPYIKLLCEPPKMDELPPDTDSTVFEFCRRHNLRSAKLELFKFFVSNLGKNLHENTICDFLWNDCSKKRVNLLYTYIRDLRKCCICDNDVKFEIEHPKKEHYRLVLINVPGKS